MIKLFNKYLLIVFLIPSLLSAQFYFFGRNKVQYNQFNWKVLHTEHFNIYYYDDFGDLAEIGAKYAEDAFDELKVRFNHIVLNKIPLIFYNSHAHFQQTNTIPSFIPEGVGGFFEFMKGRVVIPYLGSVSKFQHVIRHELVHVFMTSKVYHVVTDHRVYSERTPPLWFTEGLAEYWSSDWDTQSEMVMRDAVLNNIFVSLKNIDAINGSYLMYKEGQKFLEFVGDKYGEDKILSMIENIWRFQNFNDVIDFTIGDKFDDIDENWIYKMRQEYFPLYESYFPHTIQAKKISNSGFNFSPRIFTSNGKKEIYFIGNHNGYTSLMRMPFKPDSTDYAKAEVLIEGENKPEYESFHILENSIDVSSDGIVAFITTSQGKDVIHLYSIPDEDVNETLSFDELIRIKSPAFSKDGKLLTFSAADSKGYYDIYVYNFSTKLLRRITNDYYEDLDPIFDSANQKIIFSSDRTDGMFKQKFNLFEVNLTTLAIKYLTYVNANLSVPQFSPTGKELYFCADYDGTFNIWEMPFGNSNSQGMTQLTKFITSVYSFSFADENNIVTSGFEKFSFQFYTLDVSSIPDSTKRFVGFKYDDIGSKWVAAPLKIDSEKDRLTYDREYTLDYAVSQFITDPVYGNRGGAMLTLSDLLGDDHYVFYIYNTAEIQSEIMKNFNVMLSRVNLKDRSNYGYGIFNFAGRRYDIRDSDEFFYERVYGGYISLFYPFSMFDRLETEVSLANSDKELYGSLFTRKALLLSNSLSYVHDNSIWLSTGPIDGSRFRVLLGYTSDVKNSNVNYYSFIADYRRYFRLGLKSTFATRAAIFVNHGKEAMRFIAGGSWDIRGWNRFSIRGEKLWLASAELRFPLVDQLYINFPFFGLGFFNIRGATFFDAGSAWDDDYKETYGSLGFGVRLNLFGVIALRYDIGKKIEKNFGQLQPGLFYQFFFGWDF